MITQLPLRNGVHEHLRVYSPWLIDLTGQPMSDKMWTPSPERVAAARMTAFARRIAERFEIEISDYRTLHAWSVRNPAEFWSEIWAYCDVIAARSADTVLSDGHLMPGARWFPGARLNFAENLLRERGEKRVMVYRDEAGDRIEMTGAELYSAVASVAGTMRAAGIGPGDRVAGFMPNRPETVVAMLAAVSTGATWTSCSPDFGQHAVLDRFGQIEPRLLFCADGYRYAGKTLDRLPVAAAVADALPSIEKVVVVPALSQDSDLSGIRHAIPYGDYGSDAADVEFEQLPFDHPLYILYSSGTTGAPKCIVHGAGGTLLQHLKEHVLHTDLGPQDRLFYFTTCGWMMWNWLVSGLAAGSGIALFEGSPFHPGPETLWRLAEEERISVFGASARYYAAVEKSGLAPGRDFDLGQLRAILSTGSPLAPATYDFIYRDIGADVQLSSISGGTDIVSCFALGNPTLPVYRGELQCLGLGMDVAVFDEEGRSVGHGKGELVCTSAFPSMPVGFWNDPDGSRYRAAYFDRFPNVWCHGDYAELTETGGMIIHGRSDAVLNPGGVRIGTAEIYRQVEKLDEVLESVVVGQSWGDDTRVVLFVQLREGVDLTDAIIGDLKALIRSNASPRHVPAKIVQVPDIPRTISGKVTELAVRDVIHGRPIGNRDALANPESLAFFENIPALQTD